MPARKCRRPGGGSGPGMTRDRGPRWNRAATLDPSRSAHPHRARERRHP